MAEYPAVSKKFSSRVKKFGLRSKLKKLVIVFFTLTMIFSFFWGEFGFFRMWLLTRKIDKLEQDIRVLKVQRNDILWETEKMKNDQAYILRYAVQTFGYARPDQKIIQFVRADSPKPGDKRTVSSRVTMDR